MIHEHELHPPWRRHVALLFLAGLCMVAFGLLTDLAEDHQLLPADPIVRAMVQSERRPALDSAMNLVTGLGSGGFLLPIALGATWWLWRRSRSQAGFLALVSAGAVVLEGVTKWATSRPRPNLSSSGFPSGHTLAAVVVFGALVYIASGRATHPLRRWPVSIAAGLIVGVVAFSRLYLDAHWFSDVLGGLSGGLAYLLLSIIVFEKLGLARRSSLRTGGLAAHPEPDGRQ
jgi:undecaprenyl-diphosphatase